MDICTIIAKNYLAHARVLARSFAEHHPGGRCYVLVIDEYDGYINPREEPFTLVTPSEIDCPEFDEMVLRYSVLELSTAVKPWLLTHLLNQSLEAITYLDPDIRVYGSLERLDELARTHGLVLTPHNSVPLPDDGERPGQIDILLAGVYNLGYVSIGASEETAALLRWWRTRLLANCVVDPYSGYFVDQRWFDLAPGFVSNCAIMREPQYNLAYWNVHARELSYDGKSYAVDGHPLAFYHFSGYNPLEPNVLSRHQTRVSLIPGTPLDRLCHDYAQELLSAGHEQSGKWPYTYALLPSGLEYNTQVRSLYEKAREEGAVSVSPFTSEGSDSLMVWLRSLDHRGPAGISRALLEVYRTRPDLQAAYTDLDTDPSGLVAWAQSSGTAEEPMLAAVMPEVANAPPIPAEVSPAPTPAMADQVETVDARAQDGEPSSPLLPWGVNVVGYFRSELGTGEAGRQVVSALDAAGVAVLPVHGRTIPPNRQQHAFTHLDHGDARYPVNIVCMNADALGEFAEQAGAGFFENRYTIGVWFWEVDRFPEKWRSAFDHVDEIWLASDHMMRSIGAAASVPVLKVTLPIELPPLLPASRAELNLPEGFMFLFSFDYHSVFERKNPLAAVEAFKRAFEPDEGAVLVIKSINAASDADGHAKLLAAAAGRADIHLIDGYLAADRKNLLVAACDCYVSLHRAEGFGLTMAEAMFLDKPVIATGYSGNLDFMTASNGFLVDYDLTEIGTGAAPYPAEGRWAQPDVSHAAALMREVFDAQDEAAARGRQGGDQIRASHSAAVAGSIMGERLELLRMREGARLQHVTTPASQSEGLERLRGAEPAPDPRLSLGRAGKLLRRLVLRALRPYTAFQRSLNDELVSSMISIEERLASLQSSTLELDLEAAQRHSLVLAQMRSASSHRELWQHITGLTRSTVVLERVASESAASIQQLHWEGEVTAAVRETVKRLDWEMHALPYMDDPPFGDVERDDVGMVQGYRLEEAPAEGDAYRTFEDTFRGAEEMIRERQRVYLKLIGERSPVLDFGCGRGEFLDLLSETDVVALGVDSDAGMVRRCHDKGYAEVVEADGIEYLAGLEDASLGAIFCAQVIEHLPLPALQRLLVLARQKLREDGILIAETVNPHSPPALKTFWVDLTHQHPIFPEVALDLCRAAGFPAAFVFHPNGSGDVHVDRFTQGEYAVVAGGRSLLEGSVDQG
jgi:glycosyltransferase involved in cell wall biosynthesis/SAM-dependent methyltransferase